MNYPRKCLPWDTYWNIIILSESSKFGKLRRVNCIDINTWKVLIKTVNDLLKRDKNCMWFWTHRMYWTEIYKKYSRLKERCNNKNHISYKNYWWRWIKCEWNSFEEFYEDMWELYQIWLSIDRINNNWNYCKDNCRWADRITQSNNTRSNIFYTYKWETLSLKQWCDKLWLKYKTIFSRIKYRWKTFEEAIS